MAEGQPDIPDVPPTQKAKARGMALVVFILSLGLFGIVVICLFFLVWRRYNRRLAADRKSSPLMPDLWQAGGDRLASEIDRDQRRAAGVHSVDDLPRDPEEEKDDDGGEGGAFAGGGDTDPTGPGGPGKPGGPDFDPGYYGDYDDGYGPRRPRPGKSGD